MERRRFIVKAGGVLAAAGAAAVVDAPNVIAQPKVQWRMSTAWTPALDILQGAAQRLGKVVEEMSGGRFRIEVFAGGQIMPPFDCFDAASQGTIEAFMASPQYWRDKEPALEWFATIPFGMDPAGHGGLVLPGRRAQALGGGVRRLQPRATPVPTAAPQMAGWFRKKINTIGDYKGLRMRIPNLGGQVVARAGATAVLTPAARSTPPSSGA